MRTHSRPTRGYIKRLNENFLNSINQAKLPSPSEEPAPTATSTDPPKPETGELCSASVTRSEELRIIPMSAGSYRRRAKDLATIGDMRTNTAREAELKSTIEQLEQEIEILEQEKFIIAAVLYLIGYAGFFAMMIFLHFWT